MQATFFGTGTDVQQVWRWLLEMPGIAVCEEYSRPDQTNRWFHGWDELVAAPDAFCQQLAAWSPGFGGTPETERITFNPATQRELQARGRTILRSPAFICVVRNSEQNGCLAPAYVKCWTEKGARQRANSPHEVLDSVDWKKFSAASASIVRQLKKASPAKLRSYPIMPDAWAKLQSGQIKLWNWGAECGYPSELIAEQTS